MPGSGGPYELPACAQGLVPELLPQADNLPDGQEIQAISSGKRDTGGQWQRMVAGKTRQVNRAVGVARRFILGPWIVIEE